MAGQCQAITLGQAAYGEGNGVGGIAVDATDVFITDGVSQSTGYVEECALGGCTGGTTTIYTVPGNAYLERLLFDPASGYLYFGSNNQGEGYAINAGGGLIFDYSDGSPYGFATDATHLYIGDSMGISYVNKTSGGTRSYITAALGYTRAVAIDTNTGNVWGAAPNDALVASCETSGSESCTTWPWSGMSPYDVHIAGTTPYVLDQGAGLYQCASEADCSLANAKQISTFGGPSFTVDPNFVYLPGPSEIEQVPIGGTTPTPMATSAGDVIAMTNDMQYVYWLTSTGVIQKVAK
jgi:hypothetical protein